MPAGVAPLAGRKPPAVQHPPEEGPREAGVAHHPHAPVCQAGQRQGAGGCGCGGIPAGVGRAGNGCRGAEGQLEHTKKGCDSAETAAATASASCRWCSCLAFPPHNKACQETRGAPRPALTRRQTWRGPSRIARWWWRHQQRSVPCEHGEWRRMRGGGWTCHVMVPREGARGTHPCPWARHVHHSYACCARSALRYIGHLRLPRVAECRLVCRGMGQE